MTKRIKLKRTGFKKANMKTFGFFLIFSTVVWLLVQLSREYTEVVEIPLNYINAPMDKSISKEKPSSTEVRLEDKGFNIFYYRVFNPNLNIDLSETEVRGQQLVYRFNDHRESIQEQLRLDFERTEFLEEEVIVDFQPKKEKKVKVVSDLNLSYAVGYSAGENISLKPDSIKVSGPESVIDTLQEVHTQSLKINNISRDLEGEVSIDTSDLGMLNFYQDKVQYSQEVEKFTEGRLTIPVDILNVPDETNLTIFPKEVLVYYQVNLDEYESVKASDFRVIADYNDLKSGDDYLIAEIAEKPGFVTNVRLNERRIQFVIKR